MTFVSGISSEEEEKKAFWRQSNNEFLAKKQDEMKKMTEQKKDTRTCFQCNTIGHIARECSKAIQSKREYLVNSKRKWLSLNHRLIELTCLKILFFEIGECSNKFYQKKAKSDNQKWVVKKAVESSSDDSDRSKSEELSSGDESDSTKSDESHVVSKCEAMLKAEKSVPRVDDENFPSLRAENYKKKIGKIEISNQFYNDKQVFDVEKAFNPKVKHIFGKMIDRKVKGVKEFYEKKRKGKKPSDGDSVTPKAGQAWVDIFFE
ncbi:putative transcription factor interactor and regulator CCHC(Zn) family [Helianthus annuus]|nr:putative transcription factor interactor and regulator CCHC(Zn) family [Helianthus annuus]